MMAAPPVPATIVDLDALGEDAHAELIEGVLYERPVTSLGHGHIAFRIAMRVAVAYDNGADGRSGWWIQGENDFTVDGQEVFRPDALGWRTERLIGAPREARAQVVPDWVCEVISESNREHDEVLKRAAYARIGVRWWWLVDPEARTLAAHVLENGRWRLLGQYEGDAAVRVPPFEAVELAMAEWWR
jgi:Uma2 family endonuclease